MSRGLFAALAILALHPVHSPCRRNHGASAVRAFCTLDQVFCDKRERFEREPRGAPIPEVMPGCTSPDAREGIQYEIPCSGMDRDRCAGRAGNRPDDAAAQRNGDHRNAFRGARLREECRGRGDLRFLNYVLLPIWVIPGFTDYLCHRSSKIEHTSGTHESMTHTLMIASTGVGGSAAMFFEVNELVLSIMMAAALAHEAILIWDLGYAAKRRPPSPTEQHIHSFLEVLPFTGLAFSVCLNPDDFAVLIGRGKRPSRFRLEPKRHPLSPLYNTVVIAVITATLILPYTEELLRCYWVDRTLLPHPVPGDG